MPIVSEGSPATRELTGAGFRQVNSPVFERD